MNVPQLSVPKITRQLHRTGLVLRKYSPQLLVGSGIAAGVYAAVLGAKAHLKAEKALAPYLQSIASLKAIEGEFNTENNKPSDYTKALAKLYGLLGLELAKVYGPAASLGAAAIAAILSAHGLLSQRNAALMAGWKLVDEAFGKYRERIADEFGAEVDERVRYGLETKKIKTVTKGRDGKKKTKTTNKTVAPDYLEDSMYARLFEDSNPSWQNDHYMNHFFLSSAESYFNQRLIARGHVFLNEVYKHLGIKETPYGQVVGWFLESDGGDNYIDFHLGEGDPAPEFGGVAEAILVDFNVDGPIWDKI